MKKQNLIKIIIPVCVVLVVAGIWLFKNTDKGSEGTVIPTDGTAGTGLVSPKNDADFVLETASVDLATLTSYGLPIIIDFGADSCVPCKEMAPVLKKLNAELKGKAIIKFVDVWKNAKAADNFPIQVIPTQVIINADGTPYVPSDNMSIEFDMYSTRDTKKHVFTVHQGGLTEEQMRTILADMGGKK